MDGRKAPPVPPPLVQILQGKVGLEPLTVLGFECRPDISGLRIWWLCHPMVWILLQVSPKEELEAQQLIMLHLPGDGPRMPLCGSRSLS